MESKPKVLITGITGYLGGRVLESYLNDGRFEIRGTVRSIANPTRLASLRTYFGEEKFSKVELVEADLLDEPSMNAAVKGCDYVVHVASPFIYDPSLKPETIIEPALKGTQYVLNACKEHKIKRLILTSSVLALF